MNTYIRILTLDNNGNEIEVWILESEIKKIEWYRSPDGAFSVAVNFNNTDDEMVGQYLDKIKSYFPNISTLQDWILARTKNP